ncbi:MFS transporter [Priestia koreensis]|uniref:MFS transporter n=1 Tax=Priestia koreensis TaxID=284581 RepID=UPI00203E7748|nr:MFS transporter [Priestia koreensis]MCM3004297.1 MFS transporter [Priestia koreensis]
MQIKGFVYSAIFLSLLSEMLLSPYYPQFFTGYFGVDGVEKTAVFIAVCRLIVMLITPVWGALLKKRYLKGIIATALLMTAILKWGLGGASTYQEFAGISFLLLLFQSAIYLLYPYLVSCLQHDQEKTVASSSYLFIFHGALIFASIAGGSIISFHNPLLIYRIFGLADLVLLIWFLTIRMAEPQTTRNKAVRRFMPKKNILTFLCLMIFFYGGHHFIRPYFTFYTEHNLTNDTQWTAILYAIPSMVAILLTIIIPKDWLRRHAWVFLIIATACGGVLLIIQSLTASLFLFFVCRFIYGVCLYIGFIGVDIWIFKLADQSHLPFYYSLLTVVQNITLLVSPISAGKLVALAGEGAPFGVAGCLLVMTAIGMFLPILNQLEGGKQHENVYK